MLILDCPALPYLSDIAKCWTPSLNLLSALPTMHLMVRSTRNFKNPQIPGINQKRRLHRPSSGERTQPVLGVGSWEIGEGELRKHE